MTTARLALGVPLAPSKFPEGIAPSASCLGKEGHLKRRFPTSA